jgi:glycogen debranching enzyme
VTTEILLRVYPELLFAWHGHSLLVTDRAGMLAPDGLQGLYEHDVRLLSRYRLLVHGRPPRLDALSGVDPHSTLAYYVAPPTPDAAGEVDALGLSREEADRQVVIRVVRFVGRGLHEDVEVANYGLTPARLDLAWQLAADFADLVEQRGGKRQQQAPVTTTWHPTPEGGELRFDYQHPRLRRGSLVRVTGGPPGAGLAWADGQLALPLILEPRERRRLCLVVAPIVDNQLQEPLFGCGAFGVAAAQAGSTSAAWTTRATRLETPNATVQRAWDRAVADLGTLALGDGRTAAEQTVPAAGVPLYVTLFGRDALTASGQGLLFAPELAEGALRLLATDMFSGWGIRTLSADNPAYNPFKYHLGSVWPVENATTCFGLKRYGLVAECHTLAKGILDAAALFEHHRLPETFGGHPRDADHPHPGIYPDACAPQAWSASAVAWLVQSMLGLWTYAPLGVVVVEPVLPPWLPELSLRGLRVGRGRVSLQFKRDANGRTDYRVLEREGGLRVLRQPPPEDLRARPLGRLRELAESLLPGH